jgi:hypothetical protein
MKKRWNVILKTPGRALRLLGLTVLPVFAWDRGDAAEPIFAVAGQQLITLNPANGEFLSSASGLNFGNLNDLAKGPDGFLYSATWDSNSSIPRKLVQLNPLTGQSIPLVTLDFGAERADVRGLAFSPSGTLFALNDIEMLNSTPDNLYTINIQTGHATLVGNTGVGGLQSLAFSPAGVLYGWDLNGLGLVQINPVTGVATDVNPSLNGFLDIQALTFGPDGTLYGARNALYTIDPSTGVTTLVGSGGYSNVYGMAVGPASIPVPEPSSIVLVAIGFTVAAGTARRHRPQ